MSQNSTFSPLILLISWFTAISLSLYYNVYATSTWVPSPRFVSSLNDSVNVAQQAKSQVALHTGKFKGQYPLLDGNAMKVCLDLLDLSAGGLNLSLLASLNPKDDVSYGSGDLRSDVRTWLTTVLINKDTCLEGLQGGASNVVKDTVQNNFRNVTSSVQSLLKSVNKNRNNDKPKKVVERSHLALSSLDASAARSIKADVVVAADGSGTFTNIMDAIDRAPNYSRNWFVIHIKKGKYQENVRIGRSKTNIMIIGDGMDSTIVTDHRNAVDGSTTFNSATFAVEGNRFVARDITFENSAGGAKGQAVALRSNADLSVFYRCGFRGYQDTLYVHSGRQFFKECSISGTVDFIFGNGAAVFQNCEILARKGNQNMNTIAAHGGADPSQENVVQGGFSFQSCKISQDKSLLNSLNSTKTYLGRPWRPFARTVFMQTDMSKIISSKGWLEWNGNENSNSLYYGEYKNSGAGADTRNRVKWRNYHPRMSISEARVFTVSNLIDGNDWLPETGVPFIEEGL